jgi:hypothetical protein
MIKVPDDVTSSDAGSEKQIIEAAEDYLGGWKALFTEEEWCLIT